MALQIYAFKDNTQLLELMIRAHSRKEAKDLLELSIEQLNDHTIGNIQLKKEIPWGNLTASGFNAQGIINGTSDELAEVSGFLGLLLPGDPNEGDAHAEDSPENSPISDVTFIAWIQFDDYDATSIIMAKGTVPTGAYSFLINQNRIELSLTQNGSAFTSASSPTLTSIFVNGEGIWVRATWTADEDQVDFFTSSDDRDSDYTQIDWDPQSLDTLFLSFIFNTSEDLEVGSSDENFTPAGFIGRALIIQDIDPTVAAGVDMYPNRDATLGSREWFSDTGEEWSLQGISSIAFVP